MLHAHDVTVVVLDRTENHGIDIGDSERNLPKCLLPYQDTQVVRGSEMLIR